MKFSFATMSISQVCRDDEILCVRVVNNDPKYNYEYRSCWDSDFSIEYSRPGCYVGFEHCHHGECHNDTTICVCEGSLCNDEKYSSEAPPITPGSGLYCYGYEHDHDSEVMTVECDRSEDFCMEMFTDTGHEIWRGCWSTDYEEGRYNYTGCEVTRGCLFIKSKI